MKIGDLLQIENIDTLCCCNFINKIKYGYDIRFLWLIGLISEMRIGLIF